MVELSFFSLSSSDSLPPKALYLIVGHFYQCYVSQLDSPEQHYCSSSNPCRIAFFTLSPIFTLRLVSSVWNDAVLKVCCNSGFFKRVEDAYYPHLWHVNTKVRTAVISRYYRVYRTIKSEHGKSGGSSLSRNLMARDLPLR